MCGCFWGNFVGNKANFLFHHLVILNSEWIRQLLFGFILRLLLLIWIRIECRTENVAENAILLRAEFRVSGVGHRASPAHRSGEATRVFDRIDVDHFDELNVI